MIIIRKIIPNSMANKYYTTTDSVHIYPMASPRGMGQPIGEIEFD